VGGFPTRTLFYQPRFGAAYDVSGNGFTVVRGGWGRFYYHSGQFTNGLDASAGVASSTLKPSTWVGGPGCPTNPSAGSALFTAYLSCLNLSATPATPSAVVSNDDKQPFTDGYSVNVDQQTPWQGLLEIGYVGNRSRDQLNNGGAGGAGSDINLVPLGAMLTAATTNPATADGDLYRKYLGYSNLKFANNNMYQNYNALQVSWIRHTGLYTIQTNYTWQKAMGIISPNIEPFNLSANYGALPSNRGQLFNAAYSIDLGNRLHVNRLVDGLGNGWQLSGVTQLESGANLTYGGNGFGGNAINGNFNASYSCPSAACLQSSAVIPGSITTANPQGIAINNQSILGTPDQELHPYLTCNPRSHTGAHQWPAKMARRCCLRCTDLRSSIQTWRCSRTSPSGKV
jgi:hypothetical protein